MLILILFDQVLPNFFNTFECSLNFVKLFPKYLLIKFIFKSSNLIFNEAMTTVVLKYCFQNSQVLSVFMNKNKTCAINTHCFHDFIISVIKNNLLNVVFVFLLINYQHINKHINIMITNLTYVWYIRQWI